MILSLIILVPIALVALWFFFKSSPKGVQNNQIHFFNAGVVVAGVLLCGALTYKVYLMLAGGTDRAWWPVLSVLGSLIVFPATLMVGGIIRSFVGFRSSKSNNA